VGSASVVNPWLLFRYYGDKLVLEQQYDVMRRYVGYLGARATNHIVSYGLGDWCDVGPKTPGESQLTSKGLTASAIYFQNVQILREASALIGRPAETPEWARLEKEVCQAFNQKFFNPALNQYDRDSQTAGAMPLALAWFSPKPAAQCLIG